MPILPAHERGKLALSAMGGLILLLLTAISTYVVTTKLNNNSAVQQQYLSALQDFNKTGAAVDVSITNLADAVIEKKGVAAARQAARVAIAEHVGACQGISEIVGSANINAYAAGLGKLRELVDDTKNPGSAMLASQARFDIMHNRKIIADQARRNVFR